MKNLGIPIWTKLKTKVEAFFSKETKGKVQLHHAVYRPRKTGRAWIEIDKCEIVSMTVMYDYVYSPERYYGSEFGMDFFLKSMREYLDLSFASILASGNPLIKAIGMLDKRLGKRRLMCMDVRDSAPIVKYFYLIRCESCGVKPTIYESKKDLLDVILTNGRCLETSTDKENQTKKRMLRLIWLNKYWPTRPNRICMLQSFAFIQGMSQKMIYGWKRRKQSIQALKRKTLMPIN